jgi:hypothetical protein
MLAIMPLYVGILCLGALFLGGRVVHLRRTERIGIGYGDSQLLRRAIRTHANFTEWVPLTVLCLVLLELQGGDPLLLHGFSGALILARVLHAFGLSRHHNVSPGRFIGASLTFTILAITAGLLVFNSLG